MYENTEHFPKKEVFGLTQQMRRAAVSVVSNIAEGCGREYVKDTLQFLYISRGSLYEVEAQLHLAFELNYLTKEQVSFVANAILKCKKILFGYIAFHKKKLK